MPEQGPLAVHADGKIVSCSRTLRDAGLRTGESLERAQQLFPTASFHRHDPDLDDAIWEDVLYLLADVAPELLALEPGWALLNPWDMKATEQLNRTLHGQLGIASRRTMAKLAALQAEPGSVLRVEPASTPTFLAQTSVGNLAAFGFEQELIDRLELFGLRTLARIVPLTRRHLHAQFGPEGRRLYELLHPDQEDPPVPIFQPPPAVSASFEFELPAREPAEVIPALHHLIELTVGQLGSRRAQRITLRLLGHGSRSPRIARRVLKESTARARHLNVIAERMLERMLAEDEPVDSLMIELGGLVQPESVQGGLFALDRPAVFDAVKSIHRRFPGRLLRAIIIDREAYIPEEGIRLEPYPIAPPERRRQRRR